MAAPSPPRSCLFSAASLFDGPLHLVLVFTRCVLLHDAASCSREDSLCERVGPCDTLSCFFFSALWLQRSQSLLVQEIQSAKDIGPCLRQDVPDHSRHMLTSRAHDLLSLLKFLTTNNEALFQLPHVPVGNRMLFNHHPECYSVLQVGMDVAPFLAGGLRCITWNTRGLIGSVFSKQKNREFKLRYLEKPFDNNSILCLQEV